MKVWYMYSTHTNKYIYACMHAYYTYILHIDGANPHWIIAGFEQ